MASRLVSVTFDSQDPSGLAAFWGRLLGREPVHQAEGVLLPGSDTQVGLRFVEPASENPGHNTLHLHVTSTDADDQLRTVERVLSLGGEHLDVGQLPDEDHIVVGDTDGNAFCVIEPGNNFLAGCGHLGEISCDGSREVGLFWSEVLGWPLVWDQDEETAIQSPAGGTKVSWGGPPDAPKRGRNRQRFELTTDDLAAESARLVALGAIRLDEWDDGDDGIELADPEGNEFRLTSQLSR